ncbi:NAD+ kinase [Pontimonas salivibrio]|uniref:NAD kinase n=1 Tax=Pontimonas salivibrio TaxID=1159327 RepID=A0A2L2BR47_9MICO|nr:NAD+ kinase [Pontimonas salivibrio]
MTRKMLVVSHVGRDDALEAAHTVLRTLLAAGVTPVVAPDQAEPMTRGLDIQPEILTQGVAATDIELGIVLGGDGTILMAAELLRGSGAPLLGVNLGHVGFLAESEKEDLQFTVDQALAKNYQVDERLTLEVVVETDSQEVFRTFALNEATVEKADRSRMVELALEVDGRPVSSFGCDGVVLSTPTGSTAYSFSAGGPIVWPQVQAMVMTPLSAHALFSRPLVVDPGSTLAVEILPRNTQAAVLWCDGRRGVDVPPGSRVSATKSSEPVRLARLHPGPFSDRLVRKFSLPVTGWRGPGEAGS